MTSEERHGVRIPTIDGVRSSSRTGSAIVADSLEPVDANLASRTRQCVRWRKEYAGFLAASTRASVHTKSSVAIAEAGLAASWDRLVVADAKGHEYPVSSWVRSSDRAQQAEQAGALRCAGVAGSGERLRRVEVPYRGEVLHGVSLERQLEDWVARGIVEPGFADAVRQVIEHPEWLSMPGHQVVLLGAGAAMGPLESLSRWGAHVIAVDVAVPAVWERIRATAVAGSGLLTMPTDRATGEPGAHVAADLGQVRTWLAGFHALDTTVLATHAYADGAAHVEINVAADVLAQDLLDARADAVLGYLNTPTDSFLAPAGAVEHARARFSMRGRNTMVHRSAALLSGRRLFQPAYAEDLSDELGRTWGLSDTLVDVQGPNYALAKRIQRWRAVVAADAGRRVSSTVAPASWTTSVTKNRVLASVYAGAAPFGVEIFDADTARALMAAKLVADTFRDLPGPDAHPEAVFADAAHGGLWRQPFEPRSALGVAALMGAPRTFTSRR